MVAGLRDILDGKEPEMPKTPAARLLYKTWQTDGIAKTMDQLKSMQSGKEYDTGTGQLSRLAGAMLQKHKVDDALQVALVAQKTSPDDIGVYYLLGQVQRAAGHRVEAIAAYSKALEMSGTPRDLPQLTAEIAELSDLAPKK